MSGARVRVAGTDGVFDATAGEDLLELLQRNAYPIATSCGGVASCGLCQLTIEAGADLLTPARAEEAYHVDSTALSLGRRLACQSRIRALDPSESGEFILRIRLDDG